MHKKGRGKRSLTSAHKCEDDGHKDKTCNHVCGERKGRGEKVLHHCERRKFARRDFVRKTTNPDESKSSWAEIPLPT